MPAAGLWKLLPASFAVALLLARPAGAQAPSASASASVAAAPPPAPSDPRIAQIRALLRADLAVEVEPASLFDVPLGDAAVIEVERVRLRALLRIIDEASEAPSAAPSEPAPKPPKSPKPAPSAQPVATPVSSTRLEIAGLAAGGWKDRVELDRARLAFYELPAAERADLLAAHKERRAAARPKETAEEQRAREADAERKKALQAAAEARSEAERLVAEEMARVIGVESQIDRVREGLAVDRAKLAARRDEILGWQRRIRDAKAAGPADADAAYSALRTTLRASRDALDAALDAQDDETSKVPRLGADPTSELGSDASTDELRKRRAEVEKLARVAQAEELELRAQRPAALQEEIATLNRERLGLLSAMSPDLRSATTGFTESGIDQARSEVRQLVLILRSHRAIVAEWLTTLRESGGRQGVSVWTLVTVLVPWVLSGLAFVWLRRRSPAFLAATQARFLELDRSERRTVPSWQSRVLVIARGVHRPLEWLAFFWLLVSLLPTTARSLLEVEILVIVVGWTLGGALVVNAINSIAAATDAEATASKEVPQLRLRSLQLVGRVVVIFALILVLSARLVGEGTLYSWVISTCWFAALPVFLLLVRWWREIVFERVERVRRKTGFQSWVLANRRGWTSFLAAMTAAVHLFTLGAYKVLRSWITSFDIARRAHAYLFKRGLDRMVETEGRAKAKPLGEAMHEHLAPDRPSDRWLACPADEVVTHLRARLDRGGVGIVAVVGPIGLGKTTLLNHLASQMPEARQATCHATTTPEDLAALLEPRADQEAAQGKALKRPRVILLDEAHALVRPVAGGLRPFDAALAFARTAGQGAIWVFALDSIIWPFLKRARDGRPLFDDVLTLAPWSDESIGELLSSRCADAGMTPTFEDLIDKLPPGADEIDKQEALAAKRTGYFRMVWDYARGNPALALEAWRSSLVEDDVPVAGVGEATTEKDGDEATAEPSPEASGEEASDSVGPVKARLVRVRPLHTPPATRLEALPDPALFILRAVLQLSRATVPELALATRLSEGQVRNAVSFGVSQGYYAVDADVVRVTWPWLRSVTLWLERRHLLVNK